LAKIALNRAGTRLAAAMPDGTTWFWDTDTGAPIGAPVKPKSSVSDVLALAFSPDGERVLLNAQRGDDNDIAIVIDLRDGRANANLEQTRPNRYFPWSVSFTPDGARLLTLNGEKRLQLWDASSGRQVAELGKQTQMPHTSAFLPDGKRVIFVNLEAWSAC
jgi:WD40 repeat protein